MFNFIYLRQVLHAAGGVFITVHELSGAGTRVPERAASVVAAHRLSCPEQVGSQLPDQALNPCLLHCQADS